LEVFINHRIHPLRLPPGYSTKRNHRILLLSIILIVLCDVDLT